MLKQALILSCILVLLGSCSALKPLGFTNDNKQESSTTQSGTGKKEVKFLDNINMNVEPGAVSRDNQNSVKKNDSQDSEWILTENRSGAETGKASSLQLKYAVLLNTEVENIRDFEMFEFIDNWYGTRYRLGGNSKSGIDCSAFTQLFFLTVYGINLPRTAREQYNLSARVNRSHLQQGDLIFFNTRGGVSHVGVFLQNNKFVHASTSGGVTISDFYDPYWHKKFVGVGRMIPTSQKENSRGFTAPVAGSN